MELLSFYWPNLIAGFFLALSLGVIGIHTIARSQALESFVLGQELQSGIVFSAFVLNLLSLHSDHGMHTESIMSLIIAFVMHILFIVMIKRYNLIRLEGSIAYVFILMAINNLFMSLNPMIESHMVNSLLGDIVTASKFESLFIALLSFLFLVFYFFNDKKILKESVEIALFNEEKQKISHQLALVFFMSLSVHILGLVFTLAMLLVAALAMLIAKIKSIKFATMMVLIINGLSVVLGFWGLGLNDRVPTSVSIVLVATILSMLFLFISKISRRSQK